MSALRSPLVMKTGTGDLGQARALPRNLTVDASGRKLNPGIVAKTWECAIAGPRLKWPASDRQPKQLVDKLQLREWVCPPTWLAPSESCGPPRFPATSATPSRTIGTCGPESPSPVEWYHRPDVASPFVLETAPAVFVGRGSRLPERGETAKQVRGNGRDRVWRRTAS
jgi:hypothetical protein